MTGINVRFLGCGDAFGSGGRLQTCIHVESDDADFLIDCGASAMVGIKRWSVDPNSLDAILLTHLHGDHFGGLPFFFLDAQLVSKRTQPLTVAGPPGTELSVREAQEALYPGSSRIQLGFPITYVEWTDRGATQIGSLLVTPYRVMHGTGITPFALRVECAGKVISYSGDTEWTDALIAAAQGADLFISECYYFEKQVPSHLNYRKLMDQRQSLGCKRMMLTHMSDEMLGQRDHLEIEGAADGKSISL